MKPYVVSCLLAAFLAWFPDRFEGEVTNVDSKEALAELVRGNNAFALDLYGRVSQGEGNQFVSPFSISCALAMTYAGARGDTAVQVAKALHFSLAPAALHPAFHHLIDELHQGTLKAGPQPAGTLELSTANALWTQTGKPILPGFQKLIEGNYDGGLYPIDFHHAPAAAREHINHWVLEQTKGKIRDLLSPPTVNTETVFILTNAIYFKALWATPFAPEMTTPDEFQVSAAEKVRVDMMHLSGRFRHVEDQATQVLELPYQGANLSMVIVLPKAKDGLKQLEASLSITGLEGWVSKLASRRVEISLPRFKLTAASELKGALSALGMPVAFDAGRADFSGITGTRELAISAVVHKAFIEVEEKGTEAAAATGVVMSRTAMAPSAPTIFRADHPFLFLIRDIRNGSILFLGRLARP